MLNPLPKSFVSVQFRGNLGNQMFQYAAGKALALRWEVPLYFFSDRYGKTFSDYELSAFQQLVVFHEETHAPLLYRKLLSLKHFASKVDSCTLNFHLCERVLARLLKKLAPIYREQHHGYYDKSFEHLRPPAKIFGFMQSERYFQSIANVIRQDFDLTCFESANTKPLLEKVQLPDTVSLHVRKSDYSAAAQLPLSYYQKAVQRISHLVADPHFYVFSDEIEKAKEMLKGLLKKATYVSGPRYNKYEDMLLMSRCGHHIIANSSFSWWAAWLSIPHAEKLVFAPRLWLLYEENRYLPDVHPHRWTLL